MIGKVTDEEALKAIVSQGIVPAIYKALELDTTVDVKVSTIGSLVNTYNEFYMTGRSINKGVNRHE